MHRNVFECCGHLEILTEDRQQWCTIGAAAVSSRRAALIVEMGEVPLSGQRAVVCRNPASLLVVEVWIV